MRRTVVIIAAVAALGAGGWLLTPPALIESPGAPGLPEDLETWISTAEAAASERYQLVAGSEKRLRRNDGAARTPRSIVYLHGFSATRQEIAPTNELVAERLGANLFETRLSGHGHGVLPMHEVRAEDWLRDGVEAISIGAAVGERVAVVGTSTGATLALALIDHPVMERVDALVLISPNIAPAAASAQWLTRPAGPLLAQLISGDTQRWTAHNEAQDRYWTTEYPTDAIVEVMRLVDRAERRIRQPIRQEVLMLVSPDDTVVSSEAARETFGALDAPRKVLVEITEPGDPSSHVLAGDILSPGKTDEVAQMIVEFLTAGEAD